MSISLTDKSIKTLLRSTDVGSTQICTKGSEGVEGINSIFSRLKEIRILGMRPMFGLRNSVRSVYK